VMWELVVTEISESEMTASEMMAYPGLELISITHSIQEIYKQYGPWKACAIYRHTL